MFRNKKFNPWPWGIAAGLCIVVAVNGFVFFLAGRNPFDLVTENYYQKALLFESTIQARNTTLRNGLKLTFSTIRKNGQTRLSAGISDRENRKIGGLHGAVTLFRPSDSKLDRQLELVENDAYLYTSEFVELKPGPWELTFSFEDKKKRVVFYKKVPYIGP